MKAFSLLERIQLDRACRRNPLFGRLVEERIIWRELIELELQEVDEQIERISGATRRQPATPSRMKGHHRGWRPALLEPVNLGGMATISNPDFVIARLAVLHLESRRSMCLQNS